MTDFTLEIRDNREGVGTLKERQLEDAIFFKVNGRKYGHPYGETGAYGSISLDRFKEILKEGQALVADIESRVKQEPTWEERVENAGNGSVIRHIAADRYYLKIFNDWHSGNGGIVSSRSFGEIGNEFIKEVKR